MWKRARVAVLLSLMMGGIASLCLLTGHASAAIGINPELSFEGKVVDANGQNIPDGTYNMEFKIYSGDSCDPDTGGGCTLDWTGNRLVSGGNGVAFAGGTYAVDLGSVTAFGSSVDWNSYPLYLALQVGSTSSCTPAGNFKVNCGGDGEMKPYILLTATPYAFNAAELDGLEADDFGQLALNQTRTGTYAIQNTSGTAFAVQSAGGSSTALAVDTGTSRVGIGTATPGSSLDIENSGSGTALNIAAGTAPTANMVNISNAGQPVTTDNTNGLAVNYTGGNAAVDGSGLRIDYTPGGTSGGTWDGLHIVANTTGAASGVISYGIELDGPSSSGSGTNEAMYIGSGWDIGIDIQSGGMQLAAQSDPASPAANDLRIYAKNIAGRILPEWIGPSGVNTPFQASLGFNRVAFSEPIGTANCTSGATGFGSSSSGGGTCTAPNLSSASLLTSTRRLVFGSGATAGTVSYQRQSKTQVWRGNASGLGGFFYTARFGTDTLQSGERAFVGLGDSIANPTNVDPTTDSSAGRVGVAIDDDTDDWSFVNNIKSTAPTVTDLGSGFAVNNSDLFELILFSAEDGTSIGYRVTDLSTGAQTSGSVSSDIPNSNTFLAPLLWVTNNATAANATLDFEGWYLESDN